MAIIDVLKEKAKADKKTIVLPESEDRRTYEAAAKILKEGIADIILVGSEDVVKKNGEKSPAFRSGILPVLTPDALI